MPIPTGGTGVQVGLIPDPFAHQLAFASQMCRFDLADTNVDPRAFLADPNPNDGDNDFGINLILLNSVARPLKLVDTLASQFNEISLGGLVDRDQQRCYPAGQVAGVVHDHEIPAAQPYPVSGKHLRPGGETAWLAGFGFYRFDLRPGYPPMSRVLSFSLGGQPVPLVGVSIRLVSKPRGIFQQWSSFASVAATADLEKDYTSLDNFLASFPPSTDSLSTAATHSTSANDRGAITVWAAPFAHDVDRLGTNTVVVWVLDPSGIVGY